MTSFQSLGLIPELLDNLQRLGYQQPTDIQQQAIPLILKGRDLMAAAQTGTGKTAGFVVPLLQSLLKLKDGKPMPGNSVRALILVPTRELAEQCLQAVQRYSAGLPLRSYAVYGGVSINPQMLAMRKGMDILVATPGRLLDLYRQNAVKFEQLKSLVLDEADRMLDLGFAGELDELFCAIPRQRQTLLFSATFSQRVRDMADIMLRDPALVEVAQANSAADTVTQWLIPVDKKRKQELLLQVLQQQAAAQVLVFVKTRKSVDELETVLVNAGYVVAAIHGDKTQASRMGAMQAFRERQVQILVATDVAARGLDVEELPLVINLELPINAEDYVHRIGRSGRKGNSGAAISLVSADEVQQLATIETLIGQLIERREDSAFTPEHKVPETALGGQIVKKPKKPKKKLIPGTGMGMAEAAQKAASRPASRRNGGAGTGRVFDSSESAPAKDRRRRSNKGTGKGKGKSPAAR
ncbi:DEAD/DEAH box helicase [Oceanobacter mangrovi]|uniref:DEAD/DEAH box helicase n=1 Tax=Oceanobacter mangrovi TaxID=2862510 RepID=UPI001C8EF954|nr:DEAD/DEAH box helicase [Oceanobacter mangrovi]